MKNLKIKFGLFSLLAILAVSVFMTSCEQEIIIDNVEAELSQEELISRLNNDQDFILLMELTEERRETLITSIEENNIEISTMKALHSSENYEAIYNLLNLDEEFEARNEKIKELSEKVTTKYSRLMDECISCTELNEYSLDSQYEALHTVLDSDIEMRGCWSWKYGLCLAGCLGTGPAFWLCEFICWVKFCSSPAG